MKIEKSALRLKNRKKGNNKKEKKLTPTPAPAPAPRFTDTHYFFLISYYSNFFVHAGCMLFVNDESATSNYQSVLAFSASVCSLYGYASNASIK